MSDDMMEEEISDTSEYDFDDGIQSTDMGNKCIRRRLEDYLAERELIRQLDEFSW